MPIPIDDSVNPISDNSQKGLIKTINALAFAIKQLSGTGSWREPPQKTISSLITEGIVGAKGDTGATGATGAKGDKGDTGASAASTISYAQIADIKAQNTNGGTYNASTTISRTLNTIVKSASWLTLNNNQFTLLAGTYYIDISSQVYGIGSARCWLHNITDNQAEIIGLSQIISNTGGTLKAMNRITILATKTLEIRLYGSTKQNNIGLGSPANVPGQSEVYTTVEITRFD
jgi:hypothetical protein